MQTEIVVAVITSIGVIIAAVIGLIPKVIKKPKESADEKRRMKEISGTYDMYYQRASIEKESDDFFYSQLVVKPNGVSELRNNIKPQSLHAEYTYSGTWFIDQDIAYISLKNDASKERVFMSMITSLGEQNSMLGILTALSSVSSPVALKVACFKAQLGSRSFNKKVLAEILEQPNRNWRSNVLIFEEMEKARFFSNNMYEEK